VRARRLAIAIIVAICIGAPIAEMFDQWDHTYQDGSDTELNAVVIALCVGVALSVAGAMIVSIRPGFSSSHAYLPTSSPLRFAPGRLARPTPASSPPTPLRV
jgi:hypothetical protein